MLSRCWYLLRQPPVQAASRADLRDKLAVAAGGVVFTTIQKFFPEEKGDTHPTLSTRRNIVVIADEAHRSQYDFVDGYARHWRSGRRGRCAPRPSWTWPCARSSPVRWRPMGILDIFATAGLNKPDISVLSDEFLAEVQGMPHRNLAVELLQKLLRGEVATRRRNVVQARSFSELLEQTLRRYQNRAIEAAQVIEELIQLARDMRAANARGEQLGLTEDELAFYDGLETNDSAVQVLVDETLRAIARQLVETVRQNVTIDWTLRGNVRAQLRVLVKRILRRHGYPPVKQEQATLTVLEQAELLPEGWAVL